MDEDEGSITVELIECGTFETTSNDVGASDWKGPGSQGSQGSERSDSGPGAYVQTGRSIKLVCHDDGPNNLQGCTVWCRLAMNQHRTLIVATRIGWALLTMQMQTGNCSGCRSTG